MEEAKGDPTDLALGRRTSAVVSHVHKQKKENSKAYIGFGHDNWNLVLHMIFGVGKSVRNSVTEEAFEILEEDFKRKFKINGDGYELMNQSS